MPRLPQGDGLIMRATLLAFAVLMAVSPLVAVHAAEMGDVKLARKAGAGDASIPPATFPHGVHRVAFKCTACHDSLFPMKAGATQISMEMIQDGKACGACHNDSGKVTFPSSVANCARCHQ